MAAGSLGGTMGKNAGNHLQESIRKYTAGVFQVPEEEITGISIMKKGMTNSSFLFSCKGSRYILRIPGKGTEFLINRKHEADVYRAIAGKGLCDNAVYLNPENGYKITKYLEGVRTCNPDSEPDLKRCMKKLRDFHNMKLMAAHEFDLFGQIEFYESLWQGQPSVNKDYRQTKENVLSLKKYICAHAAPYCLSHIDAVPDNFLFYTEDGMEKLQLTDWEYAGMQDPHVDIAMFCIYSFYDRKQTDRLIDFYFEENCPYSVRIKIYCYISVCGLLWSNWCEYKRSLGIEFKDYSRRQYSYAREYYKLAKEKMEDCR